MDEKELAVRILAALLDEPDIEHVAKLPFGKMSFAALPNMNLGCAMNRLAAKAARIAKEARVEGMLKVKQRLPGGQYCDPQEIADDIQLLIDAETAPKGE